MLQGKLPFYASWMFGNLLMPSNGRDLVTWRGCYDTSLQDAGNTVTETLISSSDALGVRNHPQIQTQYLCVVLMPTAL